MGNRAATARVMIAAAVSGMRPAAVCVSIGLSVLSLAGCPTTDLGDTPEDISLCNPMKGEPYFESMIYPNYVDRGGGSNSCIRTGLGCHDQNGGNALTFQTAPVDLKANYRAAQNYLNCGTPAMSPLLTEPLEGIDDSHGGGNIFTSINDPAVVIFLAWFQ